MLLYWLFSLALLVLLVIFQVFHTPSVYTTGYVLAFFVIALAPWVIPLIRYIQKDSVASRSFLTRAGLAGLILTGIGMGVAWGVFRMSIGNGVFFATMFLGAYFALDSRVYFGTSLFGLILVVAALLVGQNAVAESLSIFVYLSLVAGVVVEICAPWFAWLHKNSRKFMSFNKHFWVEYNKEMSLYAGWLALFAFWWVLGLYLMHTFHIFEYTNIYVPIYTACVGIGLFAWRVWLDRTYTLSRFGIPFFKKYDQ